jgi:hypothetical protein
MKQRFEKYDFEVLLLEGSYVSDPNVRRAVIKDGNDRCSVEEYASRYFRRQGYSALRVENEPISALFGVFMSPLIQDASDPHGRMTVRDTRGRVRPWDHVHLENHNKTS